MAVAMLCVGVAHADDGTDEINGWTVTPTGSSPIENVLTPATLSDPSDSLGLGTAPIAGVFSSVPATPLSSIGSNESFSTPLSSAGTPDGLIVQDNWFPGLEWVGVQPGLHNSLLAFLVPATGGKEVVDLFNFGTPDAPPLFNPDAAGPIDIGGLLLADPQDGALFNDLSDAIFKGDTADWNNAVTLFDDWLGIDSSGATDAVDPSGLLPDLGF